MNKFIPLFIVPRDAGVKILHNKHGIIVSANSKLVDKVRFEGLVEAEYFNLEEVLIEETIEQTKEDS